MACPRPALNPYCASGSGASSASGDLRASRAPLTAAEMRSLDEAVDAAINETPTDGEQYRSLALAYCRKAAGVFFQNGRLYWKLDMAAVLDKYLQNLDDAAEADGECYMAGKKYANCIAVPEGFDLVDVGMAKADASEIFALASLRLPKMAERIAKLAYFLEESFGESFTLPQHKIAKWLSKHQTSVSDAIWFLESKDVIKCVDPYFSHKEHRAKKYRFILGLPAS